MRGYSIMSNDERQEILKKHSELYNGYAVGNIPSNMTPLSVYDAAGDKDGITVNSRGEVGNYRNHNINEIAAKPLNYDEITPAYEFESDGPQQSMTQMGMGKRPYDFQSQGPSDVYEYEVEEEVYEDANFDDLLNQDEDLQQQRDQIEESVYKSLDMFKRFQKYN